MVVVPEEADSELAQAAEDDASKATATIVARQDTRPSNAGMKKKTQHKGRSTADLEVAK